MNESRENSLLPKAFADRDSLIERVKALASWAEGEPSDIAGGKKVAQEKLAVIEPLQYGKTRNFGDGAVTGLSPYIRHGVLTLAEVRDAALEHSSEPEQITKFLQELAWRAFWQRLYYQKPEWIWRDIEPYKTGFVASDYADELPGDIANGQTGVACIDAFIGDLLKDGYVHNHARMYIAAYVVHFRRVRWQAGARWFLTHLLDGDPASNNLSWQWVASTFSNKPYIFNLENVDKYFGKRVDTSAQHNSALDASYEVLNARLFPNKEHVYD